MHLAWSGAYNTLEALPSKAAKSWDFARQRAHCVFLVFSNKVNSPEEATTKLEQAIKSKEASAGIRWRAPHLWQQLLASLKKDQALSF